MARSTVHYADNKTNNILKKLHNKLRPAGTPVQRVEYIIELLLLRIFEAKLKQDDEFKPLRKLFTQDYKWKNPKTGQEENNENKLFSYLPSVSNTQILEELNNNFFPFYSTILQNARKVFEENLPQKVQDQLVLIEEVFSNSNFTNNVNSGNLQEVISLVSEIEEVLLLKTDLLGDAIESSLSETGGTKDIGLFRTPDHIRQFMVGLLEPTYNDAIFDPACGTGGFLFDSFEFVMSRIEPSREWPGRKAHSELREWFNNYFKQNKLPFPSIEQSTQFYRTGVAGIEYLGMIRKMAAINFYIRGLNPANIEQGDSLAKFNVAADTGSKSIVLANPPFGAERDQEAYPDVWGEHAKESETTILFVKLMFELLKPGGHCAVVVSEGFHTWDQFSAKALRKMLLEEAQLKAVISLPQGLFISKGGQGPKTSILLFEKGGNTDWVWFYKVTNDGYTMGTNRKEQKGNQLVECLNLFHQYVKQGKQPPERKNQFCIPSEWIKTLDPRIKEKIRIETRADMEVKGEKEKKKKESDLSQKVKAKKLTEAEMLMELKVFDQMLQNRIQNEIAKRIDKAHNYSFNLSNYKSTLSDSQISEWKEALRHIKPNAVTTIEEVYKKLKNGNPENSLPYLLKINPMNSLEADIAREYLNNLDNELIIKHKELNVIKEILKSKQKHPSEKLSALLKPKSHKIKLEDEVLYKQVKIRLYGNGVEIRGKQFGEEIKTENQYVVNAGDFIMSKIDARNGAYGIVPEELESAVVTSSFPYFEFQGEIIPHYLLHIVTQPFFYKKIEDMVSGATGRRSVEVDDFLGMDIPLPPMEEQVSIVAQIEKLKAIIEGINKIDNNFEFVVPVSQDRRLLNTFIKDSLYGLSIKLKDEGKYPVLRMNNLDELGRWHLENLKYTDDDLREERLLQYGDFIFNRTNSLDLVGKSSVVDFEMKGSWAGYLIRLKLTEELNPFFLKYLFATKRYRDYFRRTCKPAGGQANINADELGSVSIDYFEPVIQNKIVAELDAQMHVLESLRKMKIEAENKIGRILADVWGVEFNESNLSNIETVDE